MQKIVVRKFNDTAQYCIYQESNIAVLGGRTLYQSEGVAIEAAKNSNPGETVYVERSGNLVPT